MSAINPVGPAGQPTKYAVAISQPEAQGSNGLVTVVDFSGDSILATPQILPSPTYVIAVSSSTVYAINAQSTLSTVPLGSLSTLVSSNVINTVLPTNSAPISLSSFTLNGTPRVFIPETGRSSVAITSPAPVTLQQEITVGAHPVYVVGANGTPRGYVISNGDGTGAGQVSAIEGTSLSVSATFPVGVDPVYGVETADDRRAFIVNQGSGTVSVINVTNNALDSAHPVLPATGALGLNPVWADLSTVTNQLVVLNAGDGVHPGSLSIINIPLCNALAQPTNPSCDATNPVDGANFGTVTATVPVGVNPSMVSVLSDGSRAYVVNQGMPANKNPAFPNGIAGSVSVVNLISGTVTATIPAVIPGSFTSTPTCPDGSTLTCVFGTPTTVAATVGTPTGKVYVTAPDTNYMTVIETDTDTVDTHIDLQGAGIRVQVTAP